MEMPVEAHGRQLTYNGDCYWCQYAKICVKLQYNPVFTYTAQTGTKTIDVRSWFGSTDPYCYMSYTYKESDADPLVGRIFRVDPNLPGRLYVDTNNVTASDPTCFTLVVKAYNNCNYGRYALQYFKVKFEMPILDCTNITLTPPVWLSNQMT